MKKNPLLRLLKYLLPIAAVIVLFLVYPLAGVAGVLVLLAYLVYRNLPSLYTLQGNAAYNRGDLAGAAAIFRKAYKTGRAKPSITTSYAYILLKMGQIDEAYDILQKMASSKLPSDDLMYAKSNLALAIWKKGDLDAAVDMLEEVIKSYVNTTIYGSLGYFLILKGDLERALEFNREAYEYNNSNTVIQDNLGQTYHLRGENEKAAEIYEKLMAATPTFPEAYYNYGLVLEALDEPENALETMQKALDYKLTFLSTITREEIEHKLEELKQGNE